jgi:OOP family OmpA-OmpF porin
MKHARSIVVWLCFAAAVSLWAGLSFAQDQDAEGCKDSALLGRMKGFIISSCETNYDQVEFYIPDGTKTLEGQKTLISYELGEGLAAPSAFQILKNYANAIKTLGGEVVYQDDSNGTLKVVKGGKETWVAVAVYNSGTSYTLTLLDLGEMAQEVTASEMLSALDEQGFVALDIHFDTGKADIKPESMPVVDQIAVLLEENPDLRVSIEGHTDNAGDASRNKVLSEQRARAVAAAVAAKGIARDRMTTVGWGQEKPVADNRSEEGRAKNRRVEIVKK